ncbi:hypothetical protein SLEP1_g4302 [Rubroshorea leprosula]|uniref:Protein kinase domain-containing protein n=1 Tax=Rubroshorea leprosula TaxID=152421 RepID=A0AAV5HSM8_9ROSI|nr:hypothetical protein SLEP1_g4302 [Rubroshorea leprosula]
MEINGDRTPDLHPSSFMFIRGTITLSSFIFITFPILVQPQNDTFNHNLCFPFQCGNIIFPFPFFNFTSRCGLPGYQIFCGDDYQVPKIMLSGALYHVKNLFSGPDDRLLTVFNDDLVKDLKSGSCQALSNLTISGFYNNSIGPPLGGNASLTFFKCSNKEAPLPQDFLDKVVLNYSCDDGTRVHLWRDGTPEHPLKVSPSVTPSGCTLVTVPVSSMSQVFFNISAGKGKAALIAALGDGFPLQWNSSAKCNGCINSIVDGGGRCGYLEGTGIVCYCEGGCKQRKSKKRALIAGLATGGGVFVLAILVLLLVFKKKSSALFNIFYFVKNQSAAEETKAREFIATYQSNLLTNHSYHEIKKLANGFKEKIGEGGYGTVYKGELPDGRLIAVKMLDKSAEMSPDFINEVATIGRIHHVNVINLLGFCWDGSKQALIYEFMPNGSLADLLSKEEINRSLGTARLIEIALGVAHGIEYLHNGCESRILHLDIKPQNVLLDQNFNPKISDFGLAKVFSRNHSIVTMTGARGTIGYIAPEIFMRNLGKPSRKSDVYSYGMLLIEMVGEKNYVGPVASAASASSESAYFPSWICNKLIEEKNKVMVGTDSVEEEGDYIRRKMMMVGLWCIQLNPRDRPTITRVVEMLSGSIEDIEMPPKPFAFSPPNKQSEFEITSTESDNSVIPLTDRLES